MADVFAAGDLTEDRFLGGRVVLRQPRSGYRAGIDPVLLAAAVPARAGESVLDLGTGVGTVLMCLAARVTGLSLVGVEIQAAYAALARGNAVANGVEAEIVEADIGTLPAGLRARSFDHVTLNPPFFTQGSGSPAVDAGRDTGRRSAGGLAPWLEVAARRLGPGGRLSAVLRAERLVEVLAGMPRSLGGVVVLPIAPRAGRDATLCLVAARKGSRAAPRLRAPLVLHAGDRHERDGESYREEVTRILRDARELAL